MPPPIGAGVWVEFEHGDPSKPIWTGCRFAQGDPPSLGLAGLPVSPNIALQTMGQNALVIGDAPGTGGIMLKCSTGAMIIMNDTGITISNGKGATIQMTGTTISFNGTSLTILQ